ncbi:MAG: S-methyl-5-thioribose-1-phosphate isomerase, partial [Candidatus Heimdallarchaeota archaeon]|nr:S-methyl-5-thioribose-1-phosphate isomerase [Candidatus Heimdallarchaeota archaeon]
MDAVFSKVVEDIRDLRIQGATNIAVEGIKAFSALTERLEVSTLDNLYSELEKARQTLATARATEPALRNGLRYIIYNLRDKASSIQEAKEIVNTFSIDYVNLLKESKKKVISYGAHRIKDGSIIMTHCHSSLSTGIVLEAHRQGKDIQVFCTETRPRYQGRITAKEFVEAGITTTQVVDSAMRWVINRYNVDIVITGADAITSQGTVINKIGTRLLALAAREMDVPFYTAINLLKYDPETSIGKLSEIEMRSASEIWEDPPKGLNFLNPAFETVS